MTDYSKWDKKASQLLSTLDLEDQEEQEKAKQELGQDGKYPRSQAEADEQRKAKEVKIKKDALDTYRKKEEDVHQILSDFWQGKESKEQDQEGEGCSPVRYINCNDMDAGKRVLTLSDTEGPGNIILSQDLTNLECALPTNRTLIPKTYPQDAENSVEEDHVNANRIIHGLVKVNLSNLSNVTVSLRCKVITGILEVSHCSDLLIKLEKESTIVTIQADLCKNITIQFHDAPSGAGMAPMFSSPSLSNHGTNDTKPFWGDDKDDRIFHAGVSDLKMELYRNGRLYLETKADYRDNGAQSAGNASAEEVQFVTSVIGDELITEKVLKPGNLAGTTVSAGLNGGGHQLEGGSARAMTAREMKEVEQRKELVRKAIDERLGGIKILDKDGNEVPVSKGSNQQHMDTSCLDIEGIVMDCEAQKAKGNEAFVAGEYAQAVLLYTLSLDKAAELNDKMKTNDTGSEVFPKHIVLSNRSACFLKLGHHEKALADGIEAEKLKPSYVKGVFRKGLALHAMGRYQEAIISLSAALKLEPKNKQIKEALQFADVRYQQKMRKRMET